jgi:hypothetical protein
MTPAEVAADGARRFTDLPRDITNGQSRTVLEQRQARRESTAVANPAGIDDAVMEWTIVRHAHLRWPSRPCLGYRQGRSIKIFCTALYGHFENAWRSAESLLS